MLRDKPLEASTIEFSRFFPRHIGLNPTDQAQCLAALGHSDLNEFLSNVVPAAVSYTHLRAHETLR